MIRSWHKHEGFALPTVLIASVVMLIVLVSAVTATESVRSALDRQYYNELAREAAESGLAYASYCLQQNGYTPQWNDSYPLRPDRDCTGVNTNGVSQYIINQSNVRMTFSVGAPNNLSVSQLVSSTGTVELLRPSSGQPWRSYTYSASARIGVSLNLNTVVFGYAGGQGAYFGTIVADGTLRMVGYNGYGELSNGSYTNTLTPTKYILNGNDKPVSVFTNFVSGGYNTFVLTDKGTIYGAGWNGEGELGDGTTTTRSQAVLYNLPAGKTGQYVAVGGVATYVLTTDGNIYATGNCGNGRLGYSYVIAGCTNQSLPQRVNLPAVTADLNTVPTTNITTDYVSAFVRMQGGKVYGWGGNSNGQLADGTNNEYSSPVQIGTFGNTGQPKAKQIVTDGVSLWIIDDSGKLWGSGMNLFGELSASTGLIYNGNSGHCIDNKAQDGLTLWLYTCNNTAAQFFMFDVDNSIYYPNKNECFKMTATAFSLAVCDGTASQKFTLLDNGSIYNASVGKCVDNTNADGVTLLPYTCNGTPAQIFSLGDIKGLTQFHLPSVAGTPIKVTTDQWYTSVLTSNGQVWSAGDNNVGQLGNGKTSLYQPYPVQFILPSGVNAVDVFTTSYNPNTAPNAYNNTYVIGSDGKVYGAGSNNFGQLGDGTTTNRSTPVAMQTIDGVNMKALQVMAGYGTAVILADNHKVYTVGNNGNGQLGDGTTTNSSVPKANQYTNALPITEF
ncbi:MAG TPA: ricin-type beta-trefoil lectin domain protein [Candidatus Saccharimonadales bacterium]